MEVKGPPPRGLRNVRDLQAAGRSSDEPQGLVLAVCLSVSITFIVAFCVGAFMRPYVDKLWLRCKDKRNKSHGSDNAYANEGFCEGVEGVEAKEAAWRRMQPPGTGPRPAAQRAVLCENQDPFLAPDPVLYATVIPDENSGSSRKELSSQQSSEQLRDNQQTGSRNEILFPNGSTAHSGPYRHQNADNSLLNSAAQDNVYSSVLDYETGAPEYSLSERSADSTLQTVCTVPGSTCNDVTESNYSVSREMGAAIPQMLPRTHTRRVPESKEVGGLTRSPLESQGSQMQLHRATQLTRSNSFLRTQQAALLGAEAEGEVSAFSSVVPSRDSGHVDPSARPPRRGSGLSATPEWPAQKDAPSHTQYDVESNCDSDEGSLFTLSSEDSEDATAETGEETLDGEEPCGAANPLQGENSPVYKDNMRPVESLEDNFPCQKILGKYETQEDHFEKPLLSSPDSGSWKHHLENSSNTNEPENPVTWSRSLGCSPSSDGIPGLLMHNMVSQPEPVQWLYSLRDLEFSNVDVLPPTPTYPAEVLSDPGNSTSHERD